MQETLKELAGDLQVIHESLERAEAVERQLGVYWREFEAERDQLRAQLETASNNARHYADRCTALEAEVERFRGKERDDIDECVRVGHKCRIENAEQTHSVKWMLGRLEDKCADWASSYSVLYSRANAATARAESSAKEVERLEAANGR